MMAPLQTHRAHCGACSGLMAMRVDPRGCYFVCCECGLETLPRLSIAEADADVVWVPVSVRNGEQP
jgi:hypothetical protein